MTGNADRVFSLYLFSTYLCVRLAFCLFKQIIFGQV